MRRRSIYSPVFLALFMLFVSCSPSELIYFGPSSQTTNSLFGTVRGYISDISNHTFIVGARVDISSGNTVFSDETGNFNLASSLPGDWEITFSAPHYSSYTTNISIKSHQTNTLSIKLVRNNSEVIIATYNIADLLIADSHDYLAKWIKSANVDIIVLEEIQPEDAALLDSALTSNGVSLPYHGYTIQYGFPSDYIAVWSKWPVYDASDIVYPVYTDPLSGTNISLSYLRPVFKFRINVLGSYPVWFYAAHLKAEFDLDPLFLNLQKRRTQAQIIQDTILAVQNIYTDQIVILGDMNTALTEDFDSGQTVEILSFQNDNPANPSNDFIPINATFLPPDAWTISTFSSRLDHILLSPALFPYYVSNSVNIPHPSPSPSDHYPVVITLKY
ncbi:MAG: hypothetical protein HPY53_13170 [Brevinematales bacterium]|nr:hypothetical protein [Brevinematales bacterium]